jgi:hypothetical protein
MGSDRFGLRVVLVFGAVLLLVQQMVAEGVVLSVSWQQSALLLKTAEGFSLVAVDPTAKIDDTVGAIHTLSDLQPGDVIEYHGESFGGILIVDQLRVISISYDEEAEDRRPPNQPHGTPPSASYAIPTRHD